MDAAHTPLPLPVGTAEASLVNMSFQWNADTSIFKDTSGNLLDPYMRYGDYYAPPNYPQFVTGDAITLSGLFKWRKEAIDPVNDAQLGPGYFSAQCPLTVEVVLKGGNCKLSLGWYNVADPGSKTPPADTEIYPFIDDPGTALACKQLDGTPQTDGFCPLAWDNLGPIDLSKKRWTPTQFSLDLSKDTHYAGGFVAFALQGAPTSICNQTKFSMYEHNLKNFQGVPWVTALFYPSKAHPGSVYLAFEDTPMPSANWTASKADGDFNDIVYYVSGCSSGGAGGGGAGAGGANAGGAHSGGASAGAGRSGEAGKGIAGETDTGGSSGAATNPGDDAGATTVAGNPNAGTGEGTAAGALGVGGNAAPQSSDSKSSSCGCAVPGEHASRRALPLFGLALSVAFLRRRRRATSSREPRCPQ